MGRSVVPGPRVAVGVDEHFHAGRGWPRRCRRCCRPSCRTLACHARHDASRRVRPSSRWSRSCWGLCASSRSCCCADPRWCICTRRPTQLRPEGGAGHRRPRPAGPGGPARPRRRVPPLRRATARAVARRARPDPDRSAAVVALGPGWARRLSAIAPDARVVVVPNAVHARNPSHRPDGPPRVLFLGRVGDRKGTFDLVRAWAASRSPAART